MYDYTIYGDDDGYGLGGKAGKLAAAGVIPTPTPPVQKGSGTGVVVNPEGQAVWQILGYPSKDAWRAAGKPGAPADFVPVSSGGGGDAGSSSGGGAAPSASGGGGIDDFLAGIPKTYLYIGLAIGAFVLLKKR